MFAALIILVNHLVEVSISDFIYQVDAETWSFEAPAGQVFFLATLFSLWY